MLALLLIVEEDEQRELLIGIYKRYFAQIKKRLADAMPTDDVEDCMQNWFVRLINNVQQLQKLSQSQTAAYVCQTIRSVIVDYRRKKKQKEIDELQMKIFSSRKLLNGEAKILLDYLAENAQQVELSVDNVDDWAYDKNFVGKLSYYIGKATLKIKYQGSNNIGKAIERIKRGHNVAEYKKCNHGYFFCLKYDDNYEVYGVPNERTVINSHTTCIKMDYYLRNLRIE